MQLADTVMKALAPAVPHQVSAGIGNLRVIAFSGTVKEQPWVHMEIFEGSYGGRYGLDGMDTVDTLYANTRNNPIEDIELHLPLRVDRYELRENVVAAGEWRGGVGSVRVFTYLSPKAAFRSRAMAKNIGPGDLTAARDGYPGELIMETKAGTRVTLPSKVPYQKVRPGDRLMAYGPSGGGYGDPFRRDPAAVLDNVLDGLFSPEIAREHYGVAIVDGAVDVAATEKLRRTKREMRCKCFLRQGKDG